jgi:multiple sugar transport system permease protein
VAIYSFITAWGETLFASVMTTDATIPVVVGFLFLQKYLVQGLTAGAIT